jgi:hypothetical protein
MGDLYARPGADGEGGYAERCLAQTAGGLLRLAVAGNDPGQAAQAAEAKARLASGLGRAARSTSPPPRLPAAALLGRLASPPLKRGPAALGPTVRTPLRAPRAPPSAWPPGPAGQGAQGGAQPAAQPPARHASAQRHGAAEGEDPGGPAGRPARVVPGWRVGWIRSSGLRNARRPSSPEQACAGSVLERALPFPSPTPAPLPPPPRSRRPTCLARRRC